MKINKLFIAALAATTLLASCNKDNEGNGAGKAGESAKLTVNLKSVGSRASQTTAPAVSDDATIGNYTVFVFNDLGVLEQRADNQTGDCVLEDGVTTRAQYVYAIANCGNVSTIIPSTIKSKSALEGWLADLAGDASQLTNRWATGSNATALTPASFDANNEATTTVEMTFLTARITLKIVPMADYDNTKSDGSLILKSVSVLNAVGKTYMWGASQIPSTKTYYSGIDMTGMANIPSGYAVQSFLKDDITGVAKADFASKYFLHYSFANNAANASEYPAILLIEAEYDGETVYYPVHLSAAQEFNTGAVSGGIERGKSYDLTITLTGKADITTGGDYPGETGGDDDPTDEPQQAAKLTVTLEIADWTPVVLEKEF